MRLRTLGALTLSLALAGSVTPLASAATIAPRATPGSSATEFYVASGDGYEVGGGVTIDSTSPTVAVSADLTAVTASASGWQLSLTSSSALTAGTTYSTGLSISYNGNTCTSGSFTVVEISATDVNATFISDCYTTTSAPGAVGFVRYNATQATPVPSLPSSAQPITDPPHSGTTSANADEFYIQSAPGAELSASPAQDFTGSTVKATGNAGWVDVTTGSTLSDWNWEISAPYDQQLVPGTYVGATSQVSATTGGIQLIKGDITCDAYYGSWTIYQIATNPDGTIAQFNASYAFTCEATTNPALVGYVRYNATEPTPIASVLTAPVKPTTGAGEPNGQTDVTLSAAGSNATAGASYSFDFGDGTAPTVSSSPTATKPEWEGTYKVVVTITDAGQTAVSTTQWLTVGDGYHPITPVRLIDTRAAHQVGPYTGPIGAMKSIDVTLPSSIADSGHGALEAVVLNVTVTQPTAGGNIRVYSTGLSRNPTTSNVNFGAGQTVANQVTVAMTPGGKVELNVQQNSGSVQLVVDVQGYYVAGNDPTNSGYAALNSIRIVDTRSSTGGVGGRLSAWKRVRLALPSSVPIGASAVALNVTVVNTSSFGDLKVYPDSGTVPNISNLNFAKGNTVPNLVIVGVPSDRVIDFYLDSNGSADLLVDLEGYYSTSATAKFVPSYPTRMFDTRTGEAGGIVKSGYAVISSMSYWLQVPSPAITAAVYNVTVTQPQGNGNIIVFPNTDTTLPTTSNVNFSKGQTVANAAIGQLKGDGREVFFNYSYSSTQLIVDFFGYFAVPTSTTAPPTAATSGDRTWASAQSFVPGNRALAAH
jgi:hypothetical protein